MAQRFHKTKPHEDKSHLDKMRLGFWIRVFIFFLGALLIASIAWAKGQPPDGSIPAIIPAEKSSSNIRIYKKKVENGLDHFLSHPQSKEIH
jgi:hypothetical protein